jgi:hypothetical protein
MIAIAGTSWAGDVKVSFSNGLVTVIAVDATPRQILSEWARVGQVRVANLDRLAGAPITVRIVDVPEAQALETLLRGTAGYVAGPRAETVVAASNYDRIVLMPGVAPAMPAAGAASATGMTGGRGRQTFVPAIDTAADEDPDAMRSSVAFQAARDALRTDPSRQPGPMQIVSPGILAPSIGPYAAGSGSTTPAENARQPQSPGAATPGVFTAAPPSSRPQPITTTPYSNDGPPPLVEPPTAVSSPVPGQIVGRPVQPTAAPTPGTFQNPYGLPEPIRPPVVNPSANPYGLTPPVKATPAPTTPPAPIKKSGTDGGQGAA